MADTTKVRTINNEDMDKELIYLRTKAQEINDSINQSLVVNRIQESKKNKNKRTNKPK